VAGSGLQVTAPDRPKTTGTWSWLFWLRLARRNAIVLIFLALFVGLAISSDAFLTKENLLNLLDQNAGVGIVACGMTLVIISGNFDLSVGAIFAMAGICAALLANAGVPIWLAWLLGASAGMPLGFINGLLVTKAGINSFIATLSTQLVFRGCATLITGATIITVTNLSFTNLGVNKALGLSFPTWIFIAVVVISGLLLARSALGRYIYASGGNAEAARLSGIRVEYVQIAAFVISGLAAATAGVIEVSRVASAQAPNGAGLELSAIAAAVLGGTSILGGEGAIWRTVFGVMILGLIGNGFNLLNLNPSYETVIQGSLIALACGIDVWSRRHQS
jgi:ribose transport system permease protein